MKENQDKVDEVFYYYLDFKKNLLNTWYNKRYNRIRSSYGLGSRALETDSWGLGSTCFVTMDHSFLEASVPHLLKKSIIISTL